MELALLLGHSYQKQIGVGNESFFKEDVRASRHKFCRRCLPYLLLWSPATHLALDTMVLHILTIPQH